MVATAKPKLVRICPHCGLDRVAVLDCLGEHWASDNAQLALRMVSGCPDCADTIQEAVRRLKEAA